MLRLISFWMQTDGNIIAPPYRFLFGLFALADIPLLLLLLPPLLFPHTYSKQSEKRRTHHPRRINLFERMKKHTHTEGEKETHYHLLVCIDCDGVFDKELTEAHTHFCTCECVWMRSFTLAHLTCNRKSQRFSSSLFTECYAYTNNKVIFRKYLDWAFFFVAFDDWDAHSNGIECTTLHSALIVGIYATSYCYYYSLWCEYTANRQWWWRRSFLTISAPSLKSLSRQLENRNLDFSYMKRFEERDEPPNIHSGSRIVLWSQSN